MSNLYYNRYNSFLVNGEQTVVPFVTLPIKPSDKRYIYRTSMSRLDKISQEYYNSPFFGWLIMLANPQYGGLEWNIPDGGLLIIPYPLVASIQDYEGAIKNYFFTYGR